ncbi:hypothetical protein PGTUg99_006722 [Puccinia graminis f. sp. tritici]|uniref:Uncharacterized protein n=1 Tax=Puccinia graminis f. sp. tritici TaxID=56615 RepID=A0A5B0PWH2_PUCGR|nr:hypothetical protein PGTUg99_006722 [Puccinia graminis f. sp. tritici]
MKPPDVAPRGSDMQLSVIVTGSDRPQDSALAPLRGASPLTPLIFSSIRSADDPQANPTIDDPRASLITLPRRYRLTLDYLRGELADSFSIRLVFNRLAPSKTAAIECASPSSTVDKPKDPHVQLFNLDSWISDAPQPIQLSSTNLVLIAVVIAVRSNILVALDPKGSEAGVPFRLSVAGCYARRRSSLAVCFQ